jgi:hypothetical protein
VGDLLETIAKLLATPNTARPPSGVGESSLTLMSRLHAARGTHEQAI